ncbi:hypothetical protein H7097_01780 [Aeromicrobium sp.]|nr:hypothetical protein [Candidatus Saccharibacteria bacterium]
MNNEQSTSGGTNSTAVNPAAAAHASRQGATVMDVVPPPSTAAAAQTSTEPAVVAAPPELPDIPQISDEIAEQIAADSTAPPAPMPSQVASQSSGVSSMAVPPDENDPQITSSGDSPSELIQAELERNVAKPAPVTAKVPKVPNPVRTAVIVTVFVTFMLAGLAVFAYMSTQN